MVYDEQVSYRRLDSYMTLKISNPKKMVGRLVGWLKRVITIGIFGKKQGVYIGGFESSLDFPIEL